MEEFLQRFAQGFADRVAGPFSFRMIVQPLMAVIFAIVDGLRDAKWGNPAYFWAVLSSSEHRRALLRDGWKHFGKIFLLAIVLDLLFQWKIYHEIRAGGVVVAALILAVLPYVVLRGPINRIARLFGK